MRGPICIFSVSAVGANDVIDNVTPFSVRILGAETLGGMSKAAREHLERRYPAD